jgi:hypothetical protein
MIIADHRSLGIADIIMDRRTKPKAQFKVKGRSGIWGRRCASAKQLERSLARVKR